MQNKQQITITDKSSVEITSVICVKTLDDSGILVETTLGLLSVEGSELRIENFEKATMQLMIAGNVSGAYYIEKRDKKKGRLL